MKQKVLSKNHKRVLSSSLKIVEKSIDEIKYLLNEEVSSFTKIEMDLNNTQINELITTIDTIKRKLVEFIKKYGLENEDYSFQQILHAKKSYLWTVLCDTNSTKLDSYGMFNNDLRDEFDEDINTLLNIIDRL